MPTTLRSTENTPPGREGPAALATLQRLGALLVAVLPGADRDLLAPLLVVPARGVRDHDRDVVLEDRHHLLGQVDLDVGRGGVRPPRCDHERVLHRVPHLGGHLAGRRVAGRAEHQLLVGPHRLDGLVAVHPVDRARPEAEVGQPLLHLGHIVARDPLAERAVELGLDHGGAGVDRLDHGDRLDRGARHRGRSRSSRRRRRPPPPSTTPPITTMPSNPAAATAGNHVAAWFRSPGPAPATCVSAGSGGAPSGSWSDSFTWRFVHASSLGCPYVRWTTGSISSRSARRLHISRMMVTMTPGELSVDTPRVRGK